MATSGVTAWAVTAREFVTQGLRDRGILGSGEDPSNDELNDCLFRLNGILTRIGAKASALWREASGTITVTAGTPTVALAAGIREIVSARVVISAANHRQLALWERDEYFSLPNKTASGTPTIMYVSKGPSVSTAYVWPVPTANTTIATDYLRAPEIVTDAGQTLDFPEEYNDDIVTMLARRCWSMFREGDPPATLVIDADAAERRILDAGRPESYFFRGECA
jgi:hypothetical protein